MNELEKLFMEGGQANGHKPEALQKIWNDWKNSLPTRSTRATPHATRGWHSRQHGSKPTTPPNTWPPYSHATAPTSTSSPYSWRNANGCTSPSRGSDVNESYLEFGVNAVGDIRFGLAAIKGVGEAVVTEIINARAKGGSFESVYDFIERVPTAALNRRLIENLAYAGAFDCFAPDIKREDFFEKTPRESFSAKHSCATASFSKLTNRHRD